MRKQETSYFINVNNRFQVLQNLGNEQTSNSLQETAIKAYKEALETAVPLKRKCRTQILWENVAKKQKSLKDYYYKNEKHTTP